jgi:hypothetical protein
MTADPGVQAPFVGLESHKLNRSTSAEPQLLSRAAVSGVLIPRHSCAFRWSSLPIREARPCSPMIATPTLCIVSRIVAWRSAIPAMPEVSVRAAWKMRIDYGAGYRVYYLHPGARIVILSRGGRVRRQLVQFASSGIGRVRLRARTTAQIEGMVRPTLMPLAT